MLCVRVEPFNLQGHVELGGMGWGGPLQMEGPTIVAVCRKKTPCVEGTETGGTIR